MQKLLLILLLTAGTFNTSFSQWNQINFPTNVNLHCVQVIDSLIYYAAGDQGKIFKTINGGENWFDVSSSDNVEWFSMSFIDANHGWVGGRQSKVAKTTNGGASWEIKTLVTSAGNNVIETMYFYDNNEGHVAGGGYYNPDRETYIYKTTNGGSTWNLKLNLIGGVLLEMKFVDRENGFVVGTNGGFFKTNDGGNNWNSYFLNTYNWLRAVYFIDAQKGVIMGQNGSAWRTANGGTSFNPVFTSMTGMIESVCFFDKDNGWAVGENGSINFTTNGGVTWNASELTTQEYLWAIHLRGKTGIIVGDNGAIFKYDPVRSLKIIQPNGGEILKPGYYYQIKWQKKIIDKVNIDYSSDGGNSWNILDINISDTRYNWFVPNIISSQCRIRLTSVDDPTYYVISDSNFTISNTVNIEDPNYYTMEYALYQNFPNPFNPSCRINFSLPKSSKVVLSIYNSLGQEVSELVNNNFMPGYYEYEFNAANLPSGIYFYKLTTEDYSEIRKMTLLK